MPDPKEIIIWVIAVPVAIALVVMLLSHLPHSRQSATQPWGPSLAIAVAFVAAYAGLRGRPPFPPRDAQTWLLYLGGVSVLLAIAATLVTKTPWRVLLLIASIALIAASVWFTLRSRIPIIGWQKYVIGMALVAAGIAGWWWLVDRLAARTNGPAVPLVLMLTCSVAALALVNGDSVLLGQLAGAVAAALGAIMVAALYFKKLSVARGAVLTLAVVFFGVLLIGYIYGVSRLDIGLLAIAPLTAWLGELPLKSKRTRFTVRIVVVLLILLVPLVPALKGLRQTLQEQTDSYMY
jgi:hypothetical protein